MRRCSALQLMCRLTGSPHLEEEGVPRKLRDDAHHLGVAEPAANPRRGGEEHSAETSVPGAVPVCECEGVLL